MIPWNIYRWKFYLLKLLSFTFTSESIFTYNLKYYWQNNLSWVVVVIVAAGKIPQIIFKNTGKLIVLGRMEIEGHTGYVDQAAVVIWSEFSALDMLLLNKS